MMRLLFIGDVVGRSGRAAVLEQVAAPARPLAARFRRRQRRERGGRLRPHRGDLRANSSPPGRCGDARQSRLRPDARRSCSSTASRASSGPANYPSGTPGRGASVIESAKRRAAPGRQRARPHLHGRARRPVRAPSSASSASVRWARGATPRSSTSTPRRRARNGRFGHFVDGKASLDRRHPYPCAERRSSHPGRRHGFRHRRRHDRRLRFGDRHGQGGAAAPLHHPHPLRPVRAGAGAGDALRGRGGDRARRPDQSDRAGQDRRPSRPAAPDFWA